MKKIFIIAFILLASISTAQDLEINCEMQTREIRNNLNYSVVEISEENFEILKKKNNSIQFVAIDTNQLNLQNAFKEDGIKTENLEILTDKKLKYYNNEVNYRIEGEYCDHLLLYVWHGEKEFWGYITVNANMRDWYYTMGKPITIDCNTVFAYSNYYGEEEISIIEMENGKEQVLGIEGWRTKDCTVSEAEVVFKLRAMNCNQEIKYLNIKLPITTNKAH